MTRPVPPVAVDVRCSAKINLHLGVGAARPDGFHPLETVYQAIGLHDELLVSDRAELAIEVHPAGHVDATLLPQCPQDNIVARAIAAMAARTGREPVGDVVVSKQIPVAGGMAGGSANAAAALLAFDRLWEAGTPDDELLAMAAELGSDVPFALLGGTALGTGRGELLAPVDDPGPWWWVAVPSREGLSTPDVYRRFDELYPHASPQPASARPVLEALAARDVHALALALRNDLEPAALDLRPELERVLERGVLEGALRGLVSGSGPTCIFLCESPTAAHATAAALRGAGHGVVLTAAGPVPGAVVVEER